MNAPLFPSRAASGAPRRPTTSLVRLALACAVALGTVPAHAADAPPSAPGNPTAKLYPGAGGEIFWGRSTDDRGVRGYEITRDGRSLGTRDATSYYDASLVTGTAYTFTVTAIDTAGQRSAPATVRIGATGGAAATGAPNPFGAAPAGSAAAPAAPARPAAAAPAPTSTPAAAAPSTVPGSALGVRLAIYSSNTYELFWNVVPGTERYRLVSGGREVGERSALGRSQFFPNADLTRPVRYTLEALDVGGRVLAASSFTVDGTRAVPLGIDGTAPVAPAAPTTPAAPAPSTAPAAPTAQPAPSTGSQAQPASVFGVRAAIYGSNSYELFWNALPNAARYELAVNGRVLDELNSQGRSQFFGNADLTRDTRFTLEARDARGSVLATVRFSVNGTRATPLVVESVSQPASPTSTVPTLPASALGVRADVYSSNSFELFWRAVPGAQRYRLGSNGTVLNAGRPGLELSQFFGNADLTRDVPYTLEAIGNFGQVLASVTFTVNGTRAVPLMIVR